MAPVSRAPLNKQTNKQTTTTTTMMTMALEMMVTKTHFENEKDRKRRKDFQLPNTFSFIFPQRKDLYEKRKKISDLALAVALLGSVLMIIETELTMAHIYSKVSHHHRNSTHNGPQCGLHIYSKIKQNGEQEQIQELTGVWEGREGWGMSIGKR
jgi:hypothetical protein